MGTRSEVRSLVEYGRRGKRRISRRGRIEDIRTPRISVNMSADGSGSSRLLTIIRGLEMSRYRNIPAKYLHLTKMVRQVDFHITLSIRHLF